MVKFCLQCFSKRNVSSSDHKDKNRLVICQPVFVLIIIRQFLCESMSFTVVRYIFHHFIVHCSYSYHRSIVVCLYVIDSFSFLESVTMKSEV
jgi:hypothetical protein